MNKSTATLLLMFSVLGYVAQATGLPIYFTDRVESTEKSVNCAVIVRGMAFSSKLSHASTFPAANADNDQRQ